MKPEAQRIAIAEACGWVDIYHVNNVYCGLPPHGYFKQGDMMCHPNLPDYLNDLNAMREAEKVLTQEQEDKYVVTLCLDVQPKPRLHHATAAQRAEAFLRTLNLWTDDT